MNYREALAWLYGTQRFGIKLGLENIQRLLAALDLPARNQQFIHVAGTNGKGSVCAMINAIYRAAGYHTGLFTSPHLIAFRERITRTIEYGTANRAAIVIIAASGGARLYEGMLSLMQMAKTSGALAIFGNSARKSLCSKPAWAVAWMPRTLFVRSFP